MKGFKIIEKGKLSKNEMSKVYGAGSTCSGTYSVIACERTHSSCSDFYSSCTGNTNAERMCCEPYSGPTGPAGVSLLLSRYKMS